METDDSTRDGDEPAASGEGDGDRPLTGRALDRRILVLAVPAFGALVAEPLFLMTDTALVGHLGQDVLAGLGIASTILQTLVGLMVFLAYATTPTVARRLGAGDRPGAVRAGIEGMWLALGIGVVLIAVGIPLAPSTTSLFTTVPSVWQASTDYLSVSVWGLPGMLLVIAATGLLRGLQDTRTPLVIAIVGFAVNAALNAVFIYGFGLGIAGSALGTVVAQWAMALVYIGIAVRAGRRFGVSLAPGFADVGETASSSGFLLLRTVTLRASLIAVVWTGSRLGVTELAALQVLFTINSLLAFALDALAIAGQALVGHGLGAGDREEVRRVTRRLTLWGVGFGVVLGVLLLAVSGVFGYVFTSDPDVLAILPLGFVVLAISVPLAGYIYVLDGVLIGAGDARYLAVAGVVPFLALVGVLAVVQSLGLREGAALAAVWMAFAFGFMGVRAVTLWARERTDRWMVTGASRR